MIELRPYQQETIEGIQNEFLSVKKHILVTAPTGSGKTIIFSFLTKKTIERNKKVCIFTNRTELLSQSGGSLNNIGVKPFLISAGSNYVSKDASVFVAMAQTVKRRIDQKYWLDFFKTIDLFIIDEVHLQDFNFLFESGILDEKFVLGFTATARRTGKQRQLGIDFESVVSTITIKELIEMGFLVRDDYYGCSIPDLSKVGYDKMKGDYKEKDLFNSFNSKKLYAGVIRNWQNICPNTKTLVFCCNVEHSIRTCREFNEAGIKAKFLVSPVSKPKYPKELNDGSITIYNEKIELYELYCKSFIEMSGDRDTILKEFKNGEFSVLVNTNILCAGYDEPSIETIIINRATCSVSLWLQMIGRGSRIFPGKESFNILDFGDNQARLQAPYTEGMNPTLWHEESKGGGLAPIKLCGFDSKERPIFGLNNPLRNDLFNKNKLDGCKRLIHAGMTICPFCGFKYPEKEIQDVDLENVYFDTEIQDFKVTKPISKMNDLELNEYQNSKGHSPAWLWRQIYMRGSYKKSHEEGIQRIEIQDWSEESKASAKKYCERLK